MPTLPEFCRRDLRQDQSRMPRIQGLCGKNSASARRRKSSTDSRRTRSKALTRAAGSVQCYHQRCGASDSWRRHMQDSRPNDVLMLECHDLRLCCAARTDRCSDSAEGRENANLERQHIGSFRLHELISDDVRRRESTRCCHTRIRFRAHPRSAPPLLRLTSTAA